MPVEADPNIEGNRRQLLIRRSLEALLADLPQAVQRAIHLSSVPHWFDPELLHRLTGDGQGWDEALQTLLDLQLAQQDSQGHVHYQEEVRASLRSSLRQNAPEEYLQANRAAHEYFLERAAPAPVTERPRLEREALYHRLVFEEPGGLRQLNEKLQEAFSYRHLGLAELLVNQAEELRGELSPSGQQWLDYFSGSQELAARHYDRAEVLLQESAVDGQDPILQALATWKLGQLLVVRHRWSQAIRLYKDSLARLGEKDEPVFRARVLLSLGEAHRNLAEHSGGYAVSVIEKPGRLRRFLLFCQHFPFLCVEWVVRRVSFLPNLYFGTDYQDWIIDWLLYVAEGWMAKAERLLGRGDNPVELSEARLALARIEHQVGRWSRARQRYARLEKDPVISASPYRFAKVRLGQGEASLMEGKPAEAVERLTEAAATFQEFEDPVSSGTAAFLLGQAFTRLGRMEQAARSFLDSAAAAESAENSLALTRSLWSLEALAQERALSDSIQGRVSEVLDRTPVRHTVTRFPDRILQLYRNLALVIALPLAYALAYQVGSVSVILLSFVETLFLSPANTLEYPALLVLTLLAKLILPLVLAFWIYRGIYGLLGLIAVYFLGSRLVLIEQDEPVHLVTGPEGITCYAGQMHGSGPGASHPATPGHAERLAWTEIRDAATLHYQAISRPIDLISRMLLQAGPAALFVEGSTMGYRFLRRNIESWLAGRAGPAPRTYTFTFLEWRSTLVVSLLVLAFISYLFAIGQIEVSGGFSEEVVTLPISTIVEFTVVTLLLVLPAVMLWRVLAHLARLRREIGQDGVVISRWWIVAAALLSSGLALRWILYLALTE